MSDDEQTRDEIEYIVNEGPAVIEEVTEEVKPAVKAKSKAKASKPKIKITKEPVEPIREEEPE